MPKASSPSLLWFRQDLRIADNPAVAAAIGSDAPVADVYVLDDETPGKWKMGGACRWWLHHSLVSLGKDLGKLNMQLILRRGPAKPVIPKLVEEIGAEAVF